MRWETTKKMILREIWGAHTCMHTHRTIKICFRWVRNSWWALERKLHIAVKIWKSPAFFSRRWLENNPPERKEEEKKKRLWPFTLFNMQHKSRRQRIRVAKEYTRLFNLGPRQQHGPLCPAPDMQCWNARSHSSWMWNLRRRISSPFKGTRTYSVLSLRHSLFSLSSGCEMTPQ